MPGLLAGGDVDGIAFVDVDDTVREVHGYAKQGAFGYGKVRGLNIQLATSSTPIAAPVIADVLRTELADVAMRFNELRIEARLERDVRDGVIGAAEAGRAFVDLMVSGARCTLTRFPVTTTVTYPRTRLSAAARGVARRPGPPVSVGNASPVDLEPAGEPRARALQPWSAQDRASSRCAFGLFDIPDIPRARASARSWATVHDSSGTATPSASA